MECVRLQFLGCWDLQQWCSAVLCEKLTSNHETVSGSESEVQGCANGFKDLESIGLKL